MNSTSLCKFCGREIKWGRRENGTTHPPLQITGNAYVIVNNAVRETTTYERHKCTDKDIASYELAQKTEAGQEAEQRLLRKQTAESKKIAWAMVESLPCPKCGALPGEVCENLTKRVKGIAVETAWPHTERLPETEQKGSN